MRCREVQYSGFILTVHLLPGSFHPAAKYIKAIVRLCLVEGLWRDDSMSMAGPGQEWAQRKLEVVGALEPGEGLICEEAKFFVHRGLRRCRKSDVEYIILLN